MRWRAQAVLASRRVGHDPCLAGSARPASLGHRHRRAVAAALLVVGLLVAACRESPTETPVGGLPGVPAPSGATLDVGGATLGQDANEAFVAYRSMDPPEDVARRYEAELAAAGWELVERVGTWRVFRGAAGFVSVSISSEGPPTYVIVQEGAIDDGVAGGTPGSTASPPGSSLGTPEPPSRRPSLPPGHGGTPPGQASTPPGQASTPPGQASTPPGQGGTPPGQGNGQASTPPGQASTPPGQASTPPGQGGTPPGQASTPPGKGSGNGQGSKDKKAP